MMKWNRLLAFVLVGAGWIAAAVGCESGSPNSTDHTAAAADPKPVGGEQTVTYRIFRNFNAPEYPDDGGPGKRTILEALARAGIRGVDYRVELTGGKDYYTKLNVKASAGDLPDMFHVDYQTFVRLAKGGYLLPLNDWLTASPHLTRMIEPEKFGYVTIEGSIYAIPTGNRPEPYNSESRAGFVIRQDWLDKLDLKQPRTIRELHDVLYAFVHNDPDGNGKKDTWGYGAEKDHEFSGIFGAYGINPDFWHERGGRIYKGFVLPEAKDALATLQQWYKEGLIDPLFLVTESKLRNDNISSSKVGMFQNAPLEIDSNSPLIISLQRANPEARLSFFTDVKGPNGSSGFPETSPYNGLRAVSANVKQPEKLFRMLDWMQDNQGGFNLIHYGIEGEDYTYDRSTNSITLKSTYPELYRKGFSNPVRFVNDIDVRWANNSVKENVVESAKHTIKNELWKPLPAELEHSELEETLWKEYFSKIVTGEYAIDKWDEFVRIYYEQGGETVERHANEEWTKARNVQKTGM
jgi:putative aldouronate transport system substrate-binding protein